MNIYLIKVFQKEEFRNDFINGKIYLRESGFFNKLEDNYRGDKFDSKIIQVNSKIIIDGVEFNPNMLTQGFVGDDKVPILCSTIINDQCLLKNDDETIRMRQEVIDELKKFGKYGLLFFCQELTNNLSEYAQLNNIFFYLDIVKYCDTMSEQSYSLYRGNYFNKYFVKNKSYKNQNEFRFIFLSKNKTFTPLVPKDKDHIVFNIKPLVDYVSFDLNSDFLADLRF